MKIKKIIAWGMAMIMLLTALSSCKGGATDDPMESTAKQETTVQTVDSETEKPIRKLLWPSLLSGGKQKHKIVISENASLTALSAAVEVSAMLRAVTGTLFTYETDVITWQGIPDRYEVVIGDTNREETAEAKAQLSADKPYVVTEIGKRIVITAISDRYLVDAVNAFLLDYVGETSNSIDYISDENASTAKPVMPSSPTVPATPSVTLPDQTGHPENAGGTVNVEELLKVDPSYDYSSDYQIHYSGAAATTPVSPDKIQTGLIESEYDDFYDVVADVNVLQFGAVGDGVHDDTAAFKAAIDAVSRTGGTIFVPKGYYCLKESLTLPAYVTLAGELKRGTTEGTVLCIYGGKGTTDRNQSAILCGAHSSVQNLAFWYPEQTFVNGEPIPYPAAIAQTYLNGLTIRNVTFVNAYRGIDAWLNGAVYALQYIREISGTCLDYFFSNDFNLDIGKIENLDLSPRFWLESGLPGTPNEELLRTYMIRNSVGIHLGQADFFYFSDIKIEGYNKGFYFVSSTRDDGLNGIANGQLLNPTIVDCYYPIYVEKLSWYKVAGGTLRAAGNEGATAVYYGPDAGKERENQPASLFFENVEIESAGHNAILNQSSAPKTVFTHCSIKAATGSAILAVATANYSFLNTTVTSGNGREYAVITDESVESTPDIDTTQYDKVTKPASNVYINLASAPYSVVSGQDITASLQAAIDSLKATGGMVYIPGGVYYVSDHIDVWAGVEIRGCSVTAHVDLFFRLTEAGELWAEGGTNPYHEVGTVLYTDYGKGDPDGKELFALYAGSGVVGLSVEYHKQDSTNIQPYSFTFRGYGKDIYLVDVATSTAWNGVDFATNRCDNHYVEFLWSVGLNIGIKVGSGSENGIIRDCHYTVNCYQIGRYKDGNYWWNVEGVATTYGYTYVIYESKNEVLYNNFAINQVRGISLHDGAENVLSVGTAIDYADVDVYLSGNCSATIINGQFVSERSDKSKSIYMAHVYTAEDFSGKVKIYNAAMWGASNYAMLLCGTGEVIVVNSHHDKTPAICTYQMNNGKLTIAMGTVFRNSITITGTDRLTGIKIIIGCTPKSSFSVSTQIPKDKVVYVTAN